MFTSQKHALSHTISLAVNYRFFSHRDVSYRFNGKNDNVLLEFPIVDRYLCYFCFKLIIKVPNTYLFMDN